MSVNVTLDERDLAIVIGELSATCRRLTGAWLDGTAEKREAITRVVAALGAAQVRPSRNGKPGERPILQLRESSPNDGDLIGLVAEVGGVLIERGLKSFAIRLMDSLLATRSHEQAVQILENSCEVRWPPARTLGGYWRV